jgi:hypothetical protein
MQDADRGCAQLDDIPAVVQGRQVQAMAPEARFLLEQVQPRVVFFEDRLDALMWS